MAHLPEAECLLGTGAMYSRRIGLKPETGDLMFAGQKRGAFSIYIGDAPIYHFDLEGRWQRIFRDGIHFRKGLDNSVAAIERIREGANLVLRRRFLDDIAVANLDEDVRRAALEIRGKMEDGSLQPVDPPTGVESMGVGRLGSTLDRIACWDLAAWSRHRDQYRATYGPIGFLPPDAHQSIVVQASGKNPEEFASHLQDVRSLWGARTLQANHVFFGGENPLNSARADLPAMFDAINTAFPIRADSSPLRKRGLPEDEASLGGIDAMISDLGRSRPDREMLGLLATKGLRRVNLRLAIGMDPDVLRGAVADLKASDLSVALIVPIGESGVNHPVSAIRDLILPLELGPGDLIYLIDAGAMDPDGDHLATAGAAELSRAILAALEPVRKERRAKVVVYSMEKQWN